MGDEVNVDRGVWGSRKGACTRKARVRECLAALDVIGLVVAPFNEYYSKRKKIQKILKRKKKG